MAGFGFSLPHKLGVKGTSVDAANLKKENSARADSTANTSSNKAWICRILYNAHLKLDRNVVCIKDESHSANGGHVKSQHNH